MQRLFLLIIILTFSFFKIEGNLNQILKRKINNTDRAQELYLRRTFRDLKINNNSKVADIGAGVGWLTIHLAQYVGSQGKVYAVDIEPLYIFHIEQVIKTKKLNNIQAILGSDIDPKLPNNTLDAVIILIAYHEFVKPLTMLTKIYQAIKFGARLGIIDRDNDQMRIKAYESYAKTGYIPDRINETLPNHFLLKEHYIALPIVKQEITSIGFKFLFSRELANDYYLAIFIKI